MSADITVTVKGVTSVATVNTPAPPIQAVMSTNAPVAVSLVSGGPQGPPGVPAKFAIGPNQPTFAVGAGEYFWVKTDGNGNALDLLVGSV